MKFLPYSCLFVFLISCEQRTTNQTVYRADSTSVQVERVENDPDGLFADKYFTFLALDSLSEDMLRDTTIKRDYKYIKSIKRFTKDHCKFIKTGCSDTFFDENVFLVSKQKWIDDFLLVMIHDSSDFGYYHSELYVLDKHLNKIDSLVVSLSGSGIESDEPSIYYETKVFSKFEESKIITTEIEYWYYRDNDSTVIVDKAITYRQIGVDGKITILKKDKLI